MSWTDVLSAALDSGVAIASIIIFFACVSSRPAFLGLDALRSLQFPKHNTIGQDTIGKWWGNTVYLNTLDYAGAALLPLPDRGYFG